MNTTATKYQEADGPLTAVLGAVPAERWTDPSPCEGWSARDVVRHLIETQRAFLIGHGIDLGELPDVDRDPAAAWRHHSERVVEAVSDDAVPAIAYEGHFGPTSVGATLEQFHIFDMVRTAGTSPRRSVRTPDSRMQRSTGSSRAPTASARRCTWTASAGLASRRLQTPTGRCDFSPGSGAGPSAPPCRR